MKELGQLFFTGINGLTLSDEEKKFIRDENVGGVILFAQNYESPAQLAELTNSIQALRGEQPLFIACDHEGGRVLRFKKHFTHFPAMKDIGLLDSPKICFEVHEIMARELIACGVNTNLAPVCDVHLNPDNKVIGDRAFGETEERVSKLVSSAIRGLQTRGVIACAKHFPGHGTTTKDSHFDLPYVKTSLKDIELHELPPFLKAAKSKVAMMMMAHLVVDSIDPHLPCSLSEKAHQMVREKLKFNRIIISDDMEMKAIVDNFGHDEAVLKAFNAGSDIVEYRSFEKSRDALESMKKFLKEKKITPKSILEKYDRIKECKAEFLPDYHSIYIPDISKSFAEIGGQVYLAELVEKIAQIKK